MEVVAGVDSRKAIIRMMRLVRYYELGVSKASSSLAACSRGAAKGDSQRRKPLAKRQNDRRKSRRRDDRSAPLYRRPPVAASRLSDGVG
jgi:hypothetical protein